MKLKNKLLMLLMGTMLLVPCTVSAADTKEVDWKTAISMESDLDMLFGNEYDEYKTLYTTVYLNMRPVPNTKSNVSKVLAPNTEVTAVSDYNGWAKIKIKNQNDTYSYFYVWAEYLDDEKQTGEYLGKFKLTAYCNCSRCCGKWAGGATASGAMPSAGRTVAMGGIAFGTKLMINGNIYTVEDRGTPYGHVDIYHNSHSEALQFGLQYADVYRVD